MGLPFGADSDSFALACASGGMGHDTPCHALSQHAGAAADGKMGAVLGELAQVEGPRTCTMSVATMFLALMTPGTPRYWMPLLLKMVAPALNQGMCLVPSSSSGTMQPVHPRFE